MSDSEARRESEINSKHALAQRKVAEMALGPLMHGGGMKRAESSERLNVTLHQCARDGDHELMVKLLDKIIGEKRRKKINEHDENELSPLHYAARYFQLPVIKVLLQYGADPNDRGEDELTPLHFASRCRRALRKGEADQDDDDDEPLVSLKEQERRPSEYNTNENSADDRSSADMDTVVHTLIAHGARINQPDTYGMTPLHMASMRGNEVACLDLLWYTRASGKNKLDLEQPDKQNMTALHFAATHNQVRIVDLLIRAGANISASDDEQGTPLHAACAEGNFEVASLLIRAAEKADGWEKISELMSARDLDGSTPLLLAVENGYFNVAKLCIDKGAAVNTFRYDDNTCLHLAAVSGEVNLVELLVESGARIDPLNTEGATALHRAASSNRSDVVRYLIEKRARIEKHDRDNYTALLLAAGSGHTETVSTLLELGANVAACEKNDKTAVFLACEEDKPDALRVLLENERVKTLGLVNEPERYYHTPLHVAAENGYDDCVETLLEFFADIEAKNEDEQTPLHLAAREGRTYVVRQLVEFAKNGRIPIINDTDEESNTPLHLAAMAGHEAVTKVLLAEKANVEARNCNAWTPLDCAARGGWVRTAEILLDNDSPVDPLDRNKKSPLHLAAIHGHCDMLKLLLKNGAKIGARSHDNRNSLDLAIDNDQVEAAETLVSDEHWRDALMNRYRYRGRWITPMRKLILKMPTVAEKVFMKCVTTNHESPEKNSYAITFEYEFLDDVYSNWINVDLSQSDTVSISTEPDYMDDEIHVHPDAKPYTPNKNILKHNHPLKMMVTAKREDLLAHPLVTMLLRHKWNTFGRYVYYVNLLIYCVFLFFLTGYILVSKAPYSLNSTVVYKPTGECQKTNHLSKLYTVDGWLVSIFISFGKWLLLGMFVFFVMRELLQMYNGKWNYLGFENILEWVMYITTVLLVIDFCKETAVRLDWQWQSGAVAVFLAWMDLVLFIRKFPRFGIHVVMFTDILKTFLRFFVVFFLFIVAFSLAFYVLLSNQVAFDSMTIRLVKTGVMMIGEFDFNDIFNAGRTPDGKDDPTVAFDSPGTSMVKTLVMMIGEFEYDSIFTSEKAEGTGDYHAQVYYDRITLILFVAFMILMSIILMNLLVGLAVDDIKAVQEQAVLKRLAMQVELALDVESMLPMFLRRRFVVRKELIYPNQATCWHRFRDLLHLSESKISASAIAAALNPELDEWEKIEEKQDQTARELKEMKKRVQSMGVIVNRVETMLETLLEHQGIEWQEEDETHSVS